MTRRRIIACAGGILLVFAGWALWVGFQLPPPAFLLRHGLETAVGLTGRTETVEGIELFEMASGYTRVGTHACCEPGDLPGRIGAPLGLDWGTPPVHGGPGCPPRWVEFRRPFWLARAPVTNGQFERFDPDRRRVPAGAGDGEAAVGITYARAVAYCRWLSALTDGLAFRLPTEVEWEYASWSGLPGFGEGVLHWCAGSRGGVVRNGGTADFKLLDSWRFSRIEGPRALAWALYDTGFRVVAMRGGAPPEAIPPSRFPLDRWMPVAEGDLAAVHAERILYEMEGGEHFLVRFVLANRTDRPLGVDLSDYWEVFSPNQWGGVPEPRRLMINEGFSPVPPFTEPRQERLRADFAEGRLVRIPPRGEADYYREFNASGRAEVDDTASPYLFVSLVGALRFTDGTRVMQIRTTPSVCDLILPTPVEWRRVPDDARSIER